MNDHLEERITHVAAELARDEEAHFAVAVGLRHAASPSPKPPSATAPKRGGGRAPYPTVWWQQSAEACALVERIQERLQFEQPDVGAGRSGSDALVADVADLVARYGLRRATLATGLAKSTLLRYRMRMQKRVEREQKAALMPNALRELPRQAAEPPTNAAVPARQMLSAAIAALIPIDDSETRAIALCVAALTPLSRDEIHRVLNHLDDRFVGRAEVAR